MSYQSNKLGLAVLEEGDPADLTTVSDNFDKIDAVVGDIATVESSPTDAAHSVGEFLLYEGRLYKVTSAISVGDNLVLGTNVSAANIGNEIKSLRDSVDHIFTTETVTRTVTLTNGYGNALVNAPAKTGYTLVGVIGYDIGSSYCYVTKIMAHDRVHLAHVDRDSTSASIVIYLLYIRS